MNTQSVWDFLFTVPVGKIVAWLAVIASITGTACAGTVKLYKMFEKYSEIKNENEEQKKLLKKHDDVLDNIRNSLDRINNSLDVQKDVNLKQIRYTIIHTCDDALAAGEISSSKLRSLEEMFEEYTDVFHGNGYVKTLIMKVRKLPVTVRVDE